MAKKILSIIFIIMAIISLTVLVATIENNEPQTVQNIDTQVAIGEISDITETSDYIEITLNGLVNVNTNRFRINAYNLPYIESSHFLNEVSVGDTITVRYVQINNLTFVDYNEIYTLQKDGTYYLTAENMDASFFEMYKDNQGTIIIIYAVTIGLFLIFGLLSAYSMGLVRKHKI